MSETEGRLNQLEALLNSQRSLEAALDTIDDQLRQSPPKQIKLQLLAAKNKIVVELDEVRRKINDIVSRKAAINPPSAKTSRDLAKLADKTEKEANQSAAANATLKLATNALKAVDKLDLS